MTAKTLWIKDEYLQQLLDGRKTIEVRVGYDNIRRLQPGDWLRLNDVHPFRIHRLAVYANFDDLLRSEDPARMAPGLDLPDLLDALHALYPAEKEALGVYAFELVQAVRYQGAIMRGRRILLIKHSEHNGGRSYWLLPGGGREPGESEEETVAREMNEETGLQVGVERLVLEELTNGDRVYQRYKTYLCTPPASGEASPGYEPEAQAQAVYAITDVGWFDLDDEASWEDVIRSDSITYGFLKKLHSVLP